MKLPVDRKRTIIIFIIADLVFAALLFVSCISIFLFQKWGVLHFLIIGMFVAVSVFMLVLSLTRNFYVVESKYLVVVKAFKETVYNYADVVYIDKKQSEKRKVLAFYTRFGHSRYLPFDKHGEIYATFLKKCHNLLEEDQFKAKYPNAKL
jgi:hypothetical protein